MIKTPPGDLPEASRRRKSTPKGASEGTSTFQTTFFPARRAPGELLGASRTSSGGVQEPPGWFFGLPASPGTPRTPLRDHFGIVFSLFSTRSLRLCKRPKSDKQRDIRTRKLSEPTRRNDRHYEDPGAGKRTTADMTHRRKLHGDICLKLRQTWAFSKTCVLLQ